MGEHEEQGTRAHNETHDTVHEPPETPGPRRMPRRAGLGALLAAPIAVAGLDAFTQRAGAAPATAAWLLGGNTINTDGSNYLGTKNVAPIVFKTKASSSASVTEKARITAPGNFGVGTAKPSAKVHGAATATNDVGVRGTHAGNGSGVIGSSAGTGYGVTASSGYCGVFGAGTGYGAILHGGDSGSYGLYASGGSSGVYATGNYYGGQFYGPTAIYVSGTTGVYALGTSGYGVEGHANGRGVAGFGGNAGLYGSSGYVGVWGEGGSYGLYAIATNTTGSAIGVYGETKSSAGFAGYFRGNVGILGTLSKSAGSFKIDHPLDPDNKYLSHSFVESPDMMNVYNGNAVLGADGSATIELPDYFEALNRDFRYQLTPIGAPAQLYVAREISGNRFVIAGGKAGLRVSWQVTGVRRDAYARAHPIVVEENKPAAERGTRLFAQAGEVPLRLMPSADHAVTGTGAGAGAGAGDEPTTPRITPPIPNPRRPESA